MIIIYSVSSVVENECIIRAFHFFKTKLSEDIYIYPRIEDSVAQKQQNDVSYILTILHKLYIMSMDKPLNQVLLLNQLFNYLI